MTWMHKQDNKWVMPRTEDGNHASVYFSCDMQSVEYMCWYGVLHYGAWWL